LTTTSGTSVCVSCGTNAATCTSNTVIYSCKTSFVLVNNACLACPSQVKTCSATTYWITGSVTCTDGYYLASYNSCKSCTDTTGPIKDKVAGTTALVG